MTSYDSTSRTPFKKGGRVGLKRGGGGDKSKPKHWTKSKHTADMVQGWLDTKKDTQQAGTAKEAQHPHSQLKTQKELKKITDSKKYKKSDYKKKTKMLGGKTY